MAIDKRNTAQRHQLVVACGHWDAVHLGGDAVAADLLNVGDPAAVELPAAGPLEAFADGVGGGALRQGGVLQQLLPAHLVVVDAVDLEHAPGEGARLVKDHIAGLGQRLQIVGALDEHALPAGPAQTGKKAQGDADDQGAGAADDQKGEGTVEPGPPGGGCAQEQHLSQRRQERQRQSGAADRRGVEPGELGDEVLGPGLAGAGILHQIQDPGDGGLPELLGGAELQHAGHVDAAADDRLSRLDLPGQALTGQGAGVQGGAALDDLAVQGDLLAGLDHNDAAHGHLLRVHLLQAAVPLDIGIVRADVHQSADVLPALAHGIALEQLADLIEQHDRDGLGIVPAAGINGQGESAHGSHCHQEVLVKDLPVQDPPAGLLQNVGSDHQIGEQIQGQPERPPDGEQAQCHYQDRRKDDPGERLFLLFVHGKHSFQK